MEKKKLDTTHVFLQFLMMFLTLSFVLAFPTFIRDLSFFDGSLNIVPILSGVVCIILSGVTLFRFKIGKRKDDKMFLLLTIFLLLLGVLILFTTLSGSLSSSSYIFISKVITPLLLLLFLYFFFKKDWVYSNLDFWIIFSLSLVIFSKLFFFQSLFKEELFLKEYSQVIELFAYLALGIGLGNEIYDFRQEEVEKKKSKKKIKKK